MPKKLLSLLGCATLSIALLTGCGGDSDENGTHNSDSTTSPSDAPGNTPSDTPGGVVIDATIRGENLEPNGDRVKAKVGEPITINVDSDREGEFHAHTPEQELAYGEGTTTLTLTIDTPGIVEVEDHVAGKVLVSIEVS
ncbi:MAG: hypothetical protein HZY75_13525 [Nocardioidaceae bacterium]|nr:MAG: hypothetical protein HZY75_13525 [Nocardioidaceae bacterium]